MKIRTKVVTLRKKLWQLIIVFEQPTVIIIVVCLKTCDISYILGNAKACYVNRKFGYYCK